MHFCILQDERLGHSCPSRPPASDWLLRMRDGRRRRPAHHSARGTRQQPAQPAAVRMECRRNEDVPDTTSEHRDQATNVTIFTELCSKCFILLIPLLGMIGG